MNLIYRLLGFVQIRCKDKEKALNLCMENLIPYSDIFIDSSGQLLMKFKYHDYKRFKKLASCNALSFDMIKIGGLPWLLYQFRYRFGLFAGIAFGLFLVIHFSNVIWDVRVVGNSCVTTREIKEMLEGYGVSLGKKINRIDVDSIQNRILLENDDISFIAINISGNVASVEIRERKVATNNGRDVLFSNIVAKKSGIIENVMPYTGKVMVKNGQTVNKGDLLISGIYDSQTLGFRYTRAQGEILAKTVSEYFIEIPLEYEKKEYSGVVNCEKNLNFFGKTFNISKKCGNSIYLYDTIYIVDNYTFKGNVSLPISFTTKSYHEYEIVTATRTIEEAERIAYMELDKIISNSGVEFLIKKTVIPYASDKSFKIHCIVVCIENIAMTNEFFVDLENREIE